MASGGSSAAAEYLANLHTHYTGYPSVSQTPLEFVRSEARLDYSSVWLLSAGGGNVDIRRTVRHAVLQEPGQLTLLCAATNSAAAQQLRQVTADVIEYNLPTGKDGFLATNSLAAFLILLARSYSTFAGKSFPKSLEDLLRNGLKDTVSFSALDQLIEPILSREVWLVPFDPAMGPVATDLESRFSEAALGSIKLSDLRNFAHGRHHWIAKNESTSAVLAVSSGASRHLVRSTLKLIPPSVPRAELALVDDPLLGPVAGIFATMRIAELAGAHKGLDPGRPGVPRFGSQLYCLSTAPGPASEKSQDLQAIRRKFHQPIHLVRVSPLYETWREHLANFLSDIYASPIHAIVFDYDGTLVDVADRFDPPRQEIREQLLRLLNAGVKIGIATGRGKSVRRDLRQVIPREMWADVTIGYHNGAEIGPLESDLLPGAEIDLVPAIARCKTEIEKTAKIAQLIELSWSRFQLSAQWRKPQLGWKLLDVLKPIVQAAGGHDVQIVSSGHSVDILSKTISKRNVVLQLAQTIWNRLEQHSRSGRSRMVSGERSRAS